MAIHGNKSQGARTKALADFKSGELQVLVATDIAARGIDIDQLPHVVNFELPNVPEDYVHRIGRTGRAGASGEAMLLLGPRFGLGEWTVALVALAAFLGHLWPLFFRFQGGKGVATAAGALLALNPGLGAATLLSWVLVAAFFRYSSLASIVAALFAPFYQLLIWGVEPALLAVGAMCLLLIWRHEGNIRKLIKGTESRIGQKAAPAGTAPAHGLPPSHESHARHAHDAQHSHRKHHPHRKGHH
jgi:hypothetical protein